MAAVIGPNNYTPGQILKAVPGVMCDDHPEVVSVCRMVGETDSFGSEISDLCQTCFDTHLKQQANRSERPQEWSHCEDCKNASNDVRQRRSYDESVLRYRCNACQKAHFDYFVDED